MEREMNSGWKIKGTLPLCYSYCRGKVSPVQIPSVMAEEPKLSVEALSKIYVCRLLV